MAACYQLTPPFASGGYQMTMYYADLGSSQAEARRQNSRCPKCRQGLSRQLQLDTIKRTDEFDKKKCKCKI
jgi:hypothetical protein